MDEVQNSVFHYLEFEEKILNQCTLKRTFDKLGKNEVDGSEKLSVSLGCAQYHRFSKGIKYYVITMFFSTRHKDNFS